MKTTRMLILGLCAAAFAIVVAFGIVYYGERAKSNPEKYYERYLQEKLDLPFQIECCEVVDSFAAVADQQLAVRAYMTEDASESLRAAGWVASRLPDEFVQERLLDENVPFEEEILAYDEKYDCLWYYADEYREAYGKKADFFEYKECRYNSPNYRLALYVPECRMLLYKEYDS